MRRALACLLLVVACAGPAAPTSRPGPADPDGIESLNRRARAGGVRYELHGATIDDPFRALEEDSALTRAWIEAQTARTERELARLSDPAAEARLAELLNIGSIDDMAVGGPLTFVSKREGEREQPALYVLQDGIIDPTPLIDPQSFGPQAALDWFVPSPAGRYVVFGISEAGDERSTLRVVEVASRALRTEVIPHAKWSNVSWLHDETGFYYTRYPTQGEPNYDAEQEDSYFPRLFFHALGGDPAADPLVYGSAEGSDVCAAVVSEDDRWVLVINFHGWTSTDLFLLDRGLDPDARVVAPDAGHALARIALPRDARSSGIVHRDRLYVLTNAGAPRWHILAADPTRASEADAFDVVIAQGTGTIEHFVPFGDRIAVRYIDNVSSRLSMYTLAGDALADVPLPALGSVQAMDAASGGGPLSFIFSSFFHPPTLYSFDPANRSLIQIYQVAHDLTLDQFSLDRAQARSADGTEINVFYVHPKTMERNGDNPALLYGYGGFDVSLLPTFTRSALYWVERGGVYAVANLRGGGEFGEAWHTAGMLQNKPRVFEDFEAAIGWLAESGISRPSRIAITGGSNGGLLVGAMVTRVPERFGAAAAYVGLYDMLRYPLFPPARLWISEYGDPAEPEAARYLRAYSPYHNVIDGRSYPAVLIETADHDTRVFWGHSTKFAARLQAGQAGGQPVYFYMEREQGHGRGIRHSDLVRQLARRYAFIEGTLSMRGASAARSSVGHERRSQ